MVPMRSEAALLRLSHTSETNEVMITEFTPSQDRTRVLSLALLSQFYEMNVN